MSFEPSRVPSLSAHVMGARDSPSSARNEPHSRTGIMKERRNGHDYDRMSWKPLPFTEQDVTLIHMGGRARGAPQSKKVSSSSGGICGVRSGLAVTALLRYRDTVQVPLY
jgi:hypothetical protein